MKMLILRYLNVKMNKTKAVEGREFIVEELKKQTRSEQLQPKEPGLWVEIREVAVA